ncbi:MAG: sulfurtransferase TusA family protein [Desulfitobacteriaceae bacterium]
MEQIDVRGMSCPQPVLMTKKALERNSTGVVILVDSNTAKTNVERFLTLSGYTVNIAINNGDFLISATK